MNKQTEMRHRKVFRRSELTVSCESSSRRNYLGFLISIIVLILISSMIVAAIVIINPEIGSVYGKSFAPREAVTLEESMLGELSGNYFPVHWIPQSFKDGQLQHEYDELHFEDSKNIHILSLKGNDVTTSTAAVVPAVPPKVVGQSVPQIRWNYKQQSVNPNISTLLANSSLLASISHQGYRISPSKRYLLIWSAKRKQFRYSWSARYFLYDIKRDVIASLSTRNSGPLNFYTNLYSASQFINNPDLDGDDLGTRFQSVEWFSNSQAHDALIMLQNNDIYLMNGLDSATSQKEDSRLEAIRLTFTGKPGEVFNGLPDWLYEEEILTDRIAYAISADGQALSYMSFNDSQVDEVSYSMYEEQFLPRVRHLRYPRAGRVNPLVKVHVIDRLHQISDYQTEADLRSQSFELELPDQLGELQHYITQIRWLTSDRLALVWLNRAQNESFVVICSRNSSWSCEKNLALKSPGEGWLEMTDSLIPLDEQHYLTLMYKFESSEFGAFKQVALVSLDQRNTFRFLTSGPREVTSIVGVDRRRSIVFYTATPVGEPGQRQVYRIPLKAQKGQLQPIEAECLTCKLHPEECQYNSVRLSPSASYFIFECEGPSVPRYELHSILPIPLQGRQRRVSSPVAITNLHIPTIQQQSKQEQQTYSAPNSPPRFNASESSLAGGTSEESLETEVEAEIEETTTLLWTIEDNQELREKLNKRKAMPLTMRLKVPIPNTNYSAQVLLLLPPQLGSRASFKAPQLVAQMMYQALPAGANRRSKRSVAPDLTVGLNKPIAGLNPSIVAEKTSSGSQTDGIELPLPGFFTPQTIGEYTRHLSPGQQYPMVVDVYAGPGSQLADYRYRIHFGHYLASSRRTVYAMIDGRGSGFQGTKKLYELYHKFGTVEIQDQIEVVAYLTRHYSFIDQRRVAIWGWSYGGYVSAMALARSNQPPIKASKSDDMKRLASATSTNSSNLKPTPSSENSPLSQAEVAREQSSSSLRALLALAQSQPMVSPLSGVFQCAASVAPVTNWIYYDSAYTERYMSSPYLNELFDSNTPGDHNSSSSSSFAQLANGTNYANNRATPLASPWKRANETLGLGLELQLIGKPQLPVGHSSNTSSSVGGASNASTAKGSIDLNARYRAASLIENVANIGRKKFLLIHGTADDNVHFQQSIMLMKRMIQANIMFESRIYPDQDHGIANRPDKLHLGSALSNFFAECFDLVH